MIAIQSMNANNLDDCILIAILTYWNVFKKNYQELKLVR